jgi:hypothetical protein
MNISAIQTAAQKPNKDWKRDPTEIIIWIEAGGKTATHIKPLSIAYTVFGQSKAKAG